ncbi:MAG: hypothetical protein L6R36_005172 [Xanthoria steineri]|nr:MAG: hypothetical protein L6R36_005172 [Xanthoria steineri]
MSIHNQPTSFFSSTDDSSPRSSIYKPMAAAASSNPAHSPHPSLTSKRVPFMNDPSTHSQNSYNTSSLPASGGAGSDEPIQPAASYPPIPSHHLSGSLTSDDPSIPPIDTSSPEDHRISFRSTSLQSTIPAINARFPAIEPLYFTKIFRGTIGAIGLIWLDIGRQDTSPLDFSDLAHLLYCFEIYGQIICMLTGAGEGGLEAELELQRAVSDYKVRLLRMSQWATWESLLEWHKGFVNGVLARGQDRVEVWREGREDLDMVLRRRM